MKKKLYLIDGSALAYRSYFAFIKAPLINSHGENTSALFGFANALRSLLKNQSPEYLMVAFDTGAKTFRHKMYAEYKATREKMPDEMRSQIPKILHLLDNFRIKVIQQDGVEADDVLGSIAHQATSEGFKTYIVTADKDFMQLVNDDVLIYDIKSISSDPNVIDAEKVKEKFGVYPEKVIDILGLMGDSSDNIPGVPQVGPKTATKLINQFGSIENIYKNIDDVKPDKIRGKLITNEQKAFLSQKLATIKTDITFDFTIEDLSYDGPDNQKLAAFYQEQEFTNFLKDFNIPGKDENVEYHCINTWDDFLGFLKKLKQQSSFAIDTETDNIDALSANLVGISFSFKKKEAFYIPAETKNEEIQGDLFQESSDSIFTKILAELKPILEDEKIKKCGHNIKYDTKVFHNYGINLKGITFDSMIASYLLRPTTRHHNLDATSIFYLNYKKIPTSDLIGKGKNQITMDKVPVEKLTDYACEDADIAFRLNNLLTKFLNNAGLIELFEKVEMPLSVVLTNMEETGIKIDTVLLEQMSIELEEKLRELEKKIFDSADETFNINSPQQLGAILFEKMKLHEILGIKTKRTKIGYKTDMDVLESLSSLPFPKLIIEYRQLAKLKSTYTDALPKLINPKTGRLHTSFNQTITATGRLSSSSPNLQNIPIRSEMGKKIRKAFIASSPNTVLLSADYSQIELRILAHLSKDKTLIESFVADEDIHSKTASLIFDIPIDKVPPELRGKAKAINFGIIYGMGQAKLARETGISQKEAKEFIDSYFQKYPGIKNFIETTIEYARTHGFVKTLLNRKRGIPDIHSSNSRIRSNAEHIAVNTPIQGTCADMIKLAMIDIYNKLNKNNLKTKMLLQIHDELLFEVPEKELDQVSDLIKNSMETVLPLDVPTKIKIHTGKNWMKI